MSELSINLSFISSKPTGLSVYANNLLPYLGKLNPTLISAKYFPSQPCYSISSELNADRGTKGHFDRLLWTQFQLPQIYRHLGSQLLFSPIPEAPIFTNCRYIITLHDLIPLRFPHSLSPLYHYFRWWLPQVLSQAEHIICNSQATATEAIENFQIPATKITAIPLAYNLDLFNYDELQQPVDPPYFIYIGRHDPHKNVDRIISAFARLPHRGRYQLWLVGSSDRRHTPILRERVTELGLVTQVKFLEYLPYTELPQAIRQARALIFPSLWEGFGLPVLEAMACGTPVITSNLAALPEVAGNAAILVDPYDEREIASAMKEISTDDLLHNQLRQLGLNRASQFSWSKTGRKTADILAKYI
jgi:glycosyltransferase involved in cell wall biosynthesis